jgi:hypothetical protein
MGKKEDLTYVLLNNVSETVVLGLYVVKLF